MLDAKFIRQNPEVVREAMTNRRNNTQPLDEFLELDESRRRLLIESEGLKAERNRESEEIAKMKKAGHDASADITRMREVSDKIKALDAQVKEVEERLDAVALSIPNVPHADTPVGIEPDDNKLIKSCGDLPKFDFEPVPHWEIGPVLDILDFERGSKITGSGFILYKGMGARLERALFTWMLDLHTQKHGYTEVFTPFLVNRQSMIGTGQIPKMEEDMYHCNEDDLFLDPTAEVPVTNIHRDEILEADDLPIYYTAYSACFRREAGAAGKDTRGLLRVHQFNKVEMVKFCSPETSYDEHEKLLQNAEEVFQLLELPYRVLLLCTEGISFAAAKCYDLEAWAPGVGQWLECSSCSNFEDFQARRANIRFRRERGGKPEFVHTLNASGVALPRTFIAIIENYQQADGTVVVPKVLRPYMGGIEVIGKAG